MAFEVLHTIRRKIGRKKGLMALKLDMSKAYDGVEWSFLKAIMEKVGFSNHWVRLVMNCVSTATFSFLINGRPEGKVVPTRGLRPTFFFFVQKDSQRFLKKLKMTGC